MRHLVLFLVSVALLLALPATSAAQHVPQRTVEKRAHVKPEGQRVVTYARHFLGVPFVWGGSTPRTGFDCSGLVRYVYWHFGVHLPHLTYGIAERGRRVYGPPHEGDVLLFEHDQHVGIYVGSGLYLSAPHTGAVVRIQPISDWGTYFQARRLVPS